MSTHNISFHGEIRKNLWLFPLIWSYFACINAFQATNLRVLFAKKTSLAVPIRSVITMVHVTIVHEEVTRACVRQQEDS